MDEAEIRGLSPDARMTRLAAALRKPNAVKTPPLGVRNHANELGSHVDLLPASSVPLKEVLSARVTTSAPGLGPLGELFYLENPGSPNVVAALAAGVDADLEGNDQYAHVEFGHDDPQIKDFLLDDLVAASRRSEVRSLLSGLHADYARLTVYDIGAEIIAVDIIAIRPDGPGGRTLVLQVDYVHA